MESEDSGGGIGIGRNISNLQSFRPSTPPLTTSTSCRIAKRRKGIPHRSPMGWTPVKKKKQKSSS